MTPFQLAWLNLTTQRARTLVSLIGVGFAVLLVFMQLGFLDAVMRTASLLYEQLDFDLMLVSSEYVSLAKPSTFPRAYLAETRAIPEIERALPLTTMLGEWRDPRFAPASPDAPRRTWTIMILAVDPASLTQTFEQPLGSIFRSQQELDAAAIALGRVGTVLIDRTSRPEYGNRETWKPGSVNELNRRQVTIIGDVKIGTGFAYNGLLVTSEATLSRLVGWPSEKIGFGMLRLKPGSDSLRVAHELRQILPRDVQVFTRDGLNAREQKFWLTRTAVGQFFVAGVIIALLVGGVFVYQMMAADIARRLPEYATIRALGYQRNYLSNVVHWQGLLLALVGYLPGMIVAWGCYELTYQAASIPIGMTPERVLGVLVLTVGMCMGSAILAVRAVHRANPADLF